MHNDLYSTDSTSLPGPGVGAHVAASSTPGGACAATFVGSDGMPVSLCTSYVGTNPPAFAAPTVVLFDPVTANPIARLQLTKGGLLGGVYGYLDSKDRVVVADGSGSILRVAHRRTPAGYQMFIDQRIDVKQLIPQGDSITAVAPDWDGRIWFATTHGVIGTVRGDGTRAVAMSLPAGEEIANGLTLRPGGASVLTDHALYEMSAGSNGVPKTLWRKTYDRGPARKPGQLSWGSGTTPGYFGEGDDQYVAIVDSAVRPNLLVYRTDGGSLKCTMKTFVTSGQGTENAPMAWGDSLLIGSTYGFAYPPFATSGGPAVPAFASFVGGMTRIDVKPDGCHRIWENHDRLASLPHLSRADGLIQGLSYGDLNANPVQEVGPVYYAATDFRTGRRVVTTQVGVAPLDEPMQLTGVIGPGRVLWQGTLGRMLKIAGGR